MQKSWRSAGNRIWKLTKLQQIWYLFRILCCVLLFFHTVLRVFVVFQSCVFVSWCWIFQVYSFLRQECVRKLPNLKIRHQDKKHNFEKLENVCKPVPKDTHTQNNLSKNDPKSSNFVFPPPMSRPIDNYILLYINMCRNTFEEQHQESKSKLKMHVVWRFGLFRFASIVFLPLTAT